MSSENDLNYALIAAESLNVLDFSSVSEDLREELKAFLSDPLVPAEVKVEALFSGLCLEELGLGTPVQ